MKKQKPAESAGAALFSAEETVSRKDLDRVPNGAMIFHVPVCDRSIRILKKPRKGFGSGFMAEALGGLDEKQKICTVSRAWVRQLWSYVGPAKGKKGGMQADATNLLPDFKHYCVKVEQEDKR